MIINNFSTYFNSYLNLAFNLVDVIIILVPMLLAIAFVTIVERKVLGHFQRRLGPNIVGIFGILQPFADAMKLILKETIIPSQSNKIIFVLAPVSTLILSLLGWGVIPFGPGLTISDYSMGLFYSMALSSLSVYGILFAGWSANSKFAFLGSLRSTAALISYELILSSSFLLIPFLTGSLNYQKIVESQELIWIMLPLLTIFFFYFTAVLAETSRTPFDLQEAESELVAGFMTEHSSTIFVFFFLGEYGSLVLFSTISALLFLGGYNLTEIFYNDSFFNITSLYLGLKTCLFCFLFVWVRGTLARYRYDQLISMSWLVLLPLAIASIIFIPSLIFFAIY